MNATYRLIEHRFDGATPDAVLKTGLTHSQAFAELCFAHATRPDLRQPGASSYLAFEPDDGRPLTWRTNAPRRF